MKTVQLKSSTLLIAGALALTFTSTTLLARGGMEGGMMPPPPPSATGTSTSTSTRSAPPMNQGMGSMSQGGGRGNGTATGTGTSTATRTAATGQGGQPPKGRSEGGQGRAAPLTIKSIDSNSDNLITLTEFTTAKQTQIEGRFTAQDRDGNGALSATEFEERGANAPMGGGLEEGIDQAALTLCMQTKLGSSAPSRPTWSTLVARADTNSDGELSKSELVADFQTQVAAQFTALDSNSNSSLESSELQTATTKIQAQREARKSCTEEQMNVIELLNQ